MKNGSLITWKRLIPDVTIRSGFREQWENGTIVSRGERATPAGDRIIKILTNGTIISRNERTFRIRTEAKVVQ